jgi:hypothetical protein
MSAAEDQKTMTENADWDDFESNRYNQVPRGYEAVADFAETAMEVLAN